MMTDWRERAACLELPPEWWFPQDEIKPENEKALSICGQCPVRSECLNYAREAMTPNVDLIGIWGGEVFGLDERTLGLTEFCIKGHSDWMRNGDKRKCRECNREIARTWAANNQEKVRAAHKLWNDKRRKGAPRGPIGLPQCNKCGGENWGKNKRGRYCLTCNLRANRAWYKAQKEART